VHAIVLGSAPEPSYLCVLGPVRQAQPPPEAILRAYEVTPKWRVNFLDTLNSMLSGVEQGQALPDHDTHGKRAVVRNWEPTFAALPRQIPP
jgi:hypothetical protein